LGTNSNNNAQCAGTHSWDCFSDNDGYGLGSLSEEGAEMQNKFVRYLCKHGARKSSMVDNFLDVYTVIVQGEIDTLVETFFLEQSME
jgi:hypothetical protein